MKAIDINTSIIEGYLRLLENLSPVSKLDLISKLSSSVKSNEKKKKELFKEAFGAFESKSSAEEIIEGIRESRNFKRKIEKF